MNMYKWLTAASTITVLSFSLAGCGNAAGQSGAQQDDDIASARGALSAQGVPSWFRELDDVWGCGKTLQGHFQGYDSAHLYHFPGKIGYRYHFNFNANYADDRGAVVAVYDSETGERVAVAGTRDGHEASVTYEAAKNIDYLVGVFSVKWSATGDYTLEAKCERTHYCVEWERVDENNEPHAFYAQTVNSYEEGKKILAGEDNFIHEAISPGACEEQSKICPTVIDWVCDDTFTPAVTRNNLCELKVDVRQRTAKEGGAAKAHWTEGSCKAQCGGITGATCPEGQICHYFGDYPDATGSCVEDADGRMCGFNGGPCPDGYFCMHGNNLNAPEHPDQPGQCRLTCGTADHIPCPDGYHCVAHERHPDSIGHCEPADPTGRPCGFNGGPCPDGFLCVHENTDEPPHPDEGGTCQAIACKFNGVEYAAGQSFPAGDSCNTCSCNDDGSVYCTKIACPVTCEYDGHTYHAGDSFPATDGCNTCSCNDEGHVLCTKMYCPTCEYDGDTYHVGEQFPAGDGCNTCYCDEYWGVLCTYMYCNN